MVFEREGEKGKRRRSTMEKLQTPGTTSKICSRNGVFLLVARPLDHANVNIATVQEIKLKDPKFVPRMGLGIQSTQLQRVQETVGGFPCW